MNLVFLALDHGIESVRGGGPSIPFVVAETAGERHLQRFVANTLEERLHHARAAASALPDTVSASARQPAGAAGQSSEQL